MPQLLMGKGNLVAQSIEVAALVWYFGGKPANWTPPALAGATWYVYNKYIVPKVARDTGVPSV